MARWVGRNWMWAVALGTTVVYGQLAGRGGEERAKARSVDALAEVMGIVQKQAIEPPTSKQVTHATIQGMLHTLDPHSNYMDENEFRTMREDQRGSFFGIGAIIQQHLDGVVIVSTVAGGPSEKAGLRAGDYIKEIDGKSTEGWSSNQAVQKLRGDKGTVVEVAVQRPGYGELLRFSLTRGEIPSNTVTHAFMLSPTAGLIAIKDFGEQTSDEFERAVTRLKKQGMKELVLDLRNNGGGVLDAALGICRQILGPGELIVTQRGRDGRDEVVTRSPKGAVLDPFPLVVLINRASASASEIVTGAIQDHDRGLVVGQTSWGKGLVQSLMAINRTRGLALTTARYYTPSGRSIQRDYMHGLDDYFNPTEDAKEAPKPQGPTFKTDLNRTVYGGGGITPDYLVEPGRLSPFTAEIRFRHSVFFKYAVIEKEKFGIRQGEVADDAAMARFRDWMKEQKVAVSDEDWAKYKEEMRDQLTYEMQNVAFGVDGGFRYLCEKDPQVKKALELMPEATGLLKRKMALQTEQEPKAVAQK